MNCAHPEDRTFRDSDGEHCEVCGAVKPDWSRIYAVFGRFAMPVEEWGRPVPIGGYVAQRLSYRGPDRYR